MNVNQVGSEQLLFGMQDMIIDHLLRMGKISPSLTRIIDYLR